MADMEIRLQNGSAVAQFRGLTVTSGGEGNPSSFDYFITSLGTCAALTAAAYCKSRNINSEGLHFRVSLTRDPQSKLATHIKTEIVLPPDFPAEHEPRLLRAANSCYVKKHLFETPEFETVLVQP